MIRSWCNKPIKKLATKSAAGYLPELVGNGSGERARRLAARTWEFSDFLVNELDCADLKSPFEGVVAYHDSCHGLRELGIGEQPRQLLRGVAGVELREIEDDSRCCGFGGLFSTGYPELSAALGRDKIEAIRRTGASWVVSTDVSCLMQMDGLLRREGASDVKTLHLAQLLDPEGGAC